MIMLSAVVFVILLGAYPLFLKQRMSFGAWAGISAALSLVVGVLIFAIAMSNSGY